MNMRSSYNIFYRYALRASILPSTPTYNDTRTIIYLPAQKASVTVYVQRYFTRKLGHFHFFSVNVPNDNVILCGKRVNFINPRETFGEC